MTTIDFELIVPDHLTGQDIARGLLNSCSAESIRLGAGPCLSAGYSEESPADADSRAAGMAAITVPTAAAGMTDAALVTHVAAVAVQWLDDQEVDCWGWTAD